MCLYVNAFICVCTQVCSSSSGCECMFKRVNPSSCMNVCMMHEFAYVCMDLCRCGWIYVYESTCACANVHTFIRKCMCMHVCEYVCMYLHVCEDALVCACLCVHM